MHAQVFSKFSFFFQQALDQTNKLLKKKAIIKSLLLLSSQHYLYNFLKIDIFPH